MSKPIVSIANLDNKSAAEAIIDYAGDFFYSEELPVEQEEVVEDIYEEEQGTVDEDEQ